MSGFPGERERDAAESQACRAAGEKSGRALSPETGVDAVIATHQRDDGAELHPLGARNHRKQQKGNHQTHRRTHGRTSGALAGVMSSIVRAIRSPLRIRTPELAASCTARRASLSATLAGMARWACR